jgi:hypothetical protein
MSRVVWEPGWYKRIDKEIDNFMEDLAKDVFEVMELKVPVRTGYLKADLDWEYHKSDKVARIGARTAPYAIWVEEGTYPHPIDPNTKETGKQYLWWEGARHPVKHVEHPGATATHFMKESLYMERRP